ncbi:MAG: universal stress protein [Euryarchaeota archaeon]|nr:universal stress protein [Euryarchaeota archaeon]
MEDKKVIIPLTIGTSKDFLAIINQVTDWINRIDEKIGADLLYIIDGDFLEDAILADDEFFDTATKRKMITDAVVKEGEKIAGEIKAVFSEQGIEGSTKVLIGNPLEEIVRAARQTSAIAIISQTLPSGLLNVAPCPVIVFAPKKKSIRFIDAVTSWFGARSKTAPLRT